MNYAYFQTEERIPGKAIITSMSDTPEGTAVYCSRNCADEMQDGTPQRKRKIAAPFVETCENCGKEIAAPGSPRTGEEWKIWKALRDRQNPEPDTETAEKIETTPRAPQSPPAGEKTCNTCAHQKVCCFDDKICNDNFDSWIPKAPEPEPPTCETCKHKINSAVITNILCEDCNDGSNYEQEQEPETLYPAGYTGPRHRPGIDIEAGASEQIKVTPEARATRQDADTASMEELEAAAAIYDNAPATYTIILKNANTGEKREEIPGFETLKKAHLTASAIINDKPYLTWTVKRTSHPEAPEPENQSPHQKYKRGQILNLVLEYGHDYHYTGKILYVHDNYLEIDIDGKIGKYSFPTGKEKDTYEDTDLRGPDGLIYYIEEEPKAPEPEQESRQNWNEIQNLTGGQYTAACKDFVRISEDHHRCNNPETCRNATPCLWNEKTGESFYLEGNDLNKRIINHSKEKRELETHRKEAQDQAEELFKARCCIQRIMNTHGHQLEHGEEPGDHTNTVPDYNQIAEEIISRIKENRKEISRSHYIISKQDKQILELENNIKGKEENLDFVLRNYEESEKAIRESRQTIKNLTTELDMISSVALSISEQRKLMNKTPVNVIRELNNDLRAAYHSDDTRSDTLEDVKIQNNKMFNIITDCSKMLDNVELDTTWKAPSESATLKEKLESFISFIKKA